MFVHPYLIDCLVGDRGGLIRDYLAWFDFCDYAASPPPLLPCLKSRRITYLYEETTIVKKIQRTLTTRTDGVYLHNGSFFNIKKRTSCVARKTPGMTTMIVVEM